MEPEDSLPHSQQPPIVPIMSQTDPIHALPSCSFKIHVNIFLPSTPTTSQWSLSFRFSHQRAVCISLPRTSHLSHFTYHSVEVYMRWRQPMWRRSLPLDRDKCGWGGAFELSGRKGHLLIGVYPAVKAGVQTQKVYVDLLLTVWQRKRLLSDSSAFVCSSERHNHGWS